MKWISRKIRQQGRTVRRLRGKDENECAESVVFCGMKRCFKASPVPDRNRKVNSLGIIIIMRRLKDRKPGRSLD